MKHLKRIPLREVGKRKKIFLFVGLCIVTFLILILTVVFVSVIKSDSDDDGKEIKISKYIIYFFDLLLMHRQYDKRVKYFSSFRFIEEQLSSTL